MSPVRDLLAPGLLIGIVLQHLLHVELAIIQEELLFRCNFSLGEDAHAQTPVDPPDYKGRKTYVSFS